MTQEEKKEIMLKAVEALKKEYPDAICSLTYTDPLQLLIATRLAAQCTDNRVNMVTPALFERFKTAEDFADADVSEVEEYIKSCGLYKTKARDIVLMAQCLRDNYNCVVPDTIEELTKLPGIGRKTANLIVGDISESLRLWLTPIVSGLPTDWVYTILKTQRKLNLCFVTFFLRRKATIFATDWCFTEEQSAMQENLNAKSAV